MNTDPLEGTIRGTVTYHYDLAADVLYLRLFADRDTPALGEETEDGLIELRAETTGELIGITIVNWWKRFGQGPFPASINNIEAQLEIWADRLNP